MAVEGRLGAGKVTDPLLVDCEGNVAVSFVEAFVEIFVMAS